MRRVSYTFIVLAAALLVAACSGGSSGTGGDPDVPGGEDLTQGDVIFPPEDTVPEDVPRGDIPAGDTAGPDAAGPDTAGPAPVTGHEGAAMVAGSVIASSPSYRLIGTLGEPHGAPQSPNYRLQTGVIGATQP